MGILKWFVNIWKIFINLFKRDPLKTFSDIKDIIDKVKHIVIEFTEAKKDGNFTADEVFELISDIKTLICQIEALINAELTK